MKRQAAGKFSNGKRRRNGPGVWRCRCGQIVISGGPEAPAALRWTDGHVCSFKPLRPDEKE